MDAVETNGRAESVKRHLRNSGTNLDAIIERSSLLSLRRRDRCLVVARGELPIHPPVNNANYTLDPSFRLTLIIYLRRSGNKDKRLRREPSVQLYNYILLRLTNLTIW